MNQTSKSVRSCVQQTLLNKDWTLEYFKRAALFETYVGCTAITFSNIGEITLNLSRFQRMLSVQTTVLQAIVSFVKDENICNVYRMHVVKSGFFQERNGMQQILLQNIALHRSIKGVDVCVACCFLFETLGRFRDCTVLRILVDLMVARKRSMAYSTEQALQTLIFKLLSGDGLFASGRASHEVIRFIKFLVEDISKTDEDTASLSLNMLGRICDEREQFFQVHGEDDFIYTNEYGHRMYRSVIVDAHGISIILAHMRQHCDDGLTKEAGWKVLQDISRDTSSQRVNILSGIFKSIEPKNRSGLLRFMTDEQQKNIRRAEIQVNLHAYWMLYQLTKPVDFNRLPKDVLLYFTTEHGVEKVLDLLRRDHMSSKASVYLFAVLLNLAKTADDDKLLFTTLSQRRNLEFVMQCWEQYRYYADFVSVSNAVVDYLAHADADRSSGSVHRTIVHSIDDTTLYNLNVPSLYGYSDIFPEYDSDDSEEEFPDAPSHLAGMVPFLAASDEDEDQDEDDDGDVESEGNGSGEDNEDEDSASEKSVFSDNVVSSESEDGAGRCFIDDDEDDDNEHEAFDSTTPAYLHPWVTKSPAC